MGVTVAADLAVRLRPGTKPGGMTCRDNPDVITHHSYCIAILVFQIKIGIQQGLGTDVIVVVPVVVGYVLLVSPGAVYVRRLFGRT